MFFSLLLTASLASATVSVKDIHEKWADSSCLYEAPMDKATFAQLVGSGAPAAAIVSTPTLIFSTKECNAATGCGAWSHWVTPNSSLPFADADNDEDNMIQAWSLFLEVDSTGAPAASLIPASCTLSADPVTDPVYSYSECSNFLTGTVNCTVPCATDDYYSNICNPGDLYDCYVSPDTFYMAPSGAPLGPLSGNIADDCVYLSSSGVLGTQGTGWWVEFCTTVSGTIG